MYSHAHLFLYFWEAFMLPRESWVQVAQTNYPPKLKIVAVWPLAESLSVLF